MAQIANAPVGRFGEAIALHAAERGLQALGDIRAAVVGHNQPAARHQIHKPLECGLDRFQVRVNIGVIELDVREDERIGKVVQELLGPCRKRRCRIHRPQ
jgi:hypothetical protein